MVKGIVNGTTTYYPGKHYNKEITNNIPKVQKFYIAGTMTIAVRTDGVLQWILPDHLGSTSITANADGTLNSVIQYTAFGEIRLTQGVTPTKYRYTGQLAQAELGLDYYVARWYDPAIGHFTQADTIVPEPGKASAFDRYAYVQNNPLRYNDPSGHDVGCAGTDASNCSSWNHVKDRNLGYGSTPPYKSTTSNEKKNNILDPSKIFIQNNNQPNISPSIYPNNQDGDQQNDSILQYEFIDPLRVDKLNGTGISLAGSGMLDIVGVQASVDITYNWDRQDISIAIPFQFLFGLGIGISETGSVLGLYNSDSVKDFWGPGIGGQGSLVPNEGIVVGYSRSWNPNKNGRIAQAWQVGGGLGEEVSGSLVGGYTIPLMYIDLRKNWPDAIKFFPH